MARPDLLIELERAAHSDAPDAQERFDGALDRVLEQAGADAAPAPALRGLIQERLQVALGAAPGGEAGGVGASGVIAAGFARGTGGAAGLVRGTGGLRPGLPSLWARHGSKLVILATGVAIGFVWGRSPVWQAPVAAPLAAPVSVAPAAVPVVPVPAAPVPGAAPAPVEPDTAAPSSASATSADPTPAELPRPAQRAAPRAHTPPRARPEPAAAPENAASLRLVLEQLRKAQLFSRAGEHRRALAALDELDARVPLSVLQDEREVARTLALCDAGQRQAASQLAARLIERAPDSAYALSLRESCAGQHDLLEQMRERTSNPLP